MRSSCADGCERARWGVALSCVLIVVVDVASPAFDRASRADRAGVPVASADGCERARWGGALPVVVESPALNRAALADRAGVILAGADGAEFGIRGLRGAASPARDRAVGGDRAGVIPAGADRGKPARWGVGLPVVGLPVKVLVGQIVSSPARDRAVARVNRAGVVLPGTDGAVSDVRRGWRALPVPVLSPALDRAVVAADRAAVGIVGADGAVAPRWGAGLPGVFVVSPALDRAVAAADRAGVASPCTDGAVVT